MIKSRSMESYFVKRLCFRHVNIPDAKWHKYRVTWRCGFHIKFWNLPMMDYTNGNWVWRKNHCSGTKAFGIRWVFLISFIRIGKIQIISWKYLESVKSDKLWLHDKDYDLLWKNLLWFPLAFPPPNQPSQRSCFIILKI